MSSQDAAALLVPILSALIGAAGISVQDKRTRRSADEQRRVAFEDASRTVAFATQWVQARQSMGRSAEVSESDAQLAASWLDDALAIVQLTSPAVVTKPSRSLVSRLFLLYGMKGWGANVVRVVFYLPVAYVGWIALIAVGEILGGVTYADQASWEVTGSVLGAVLALALRGWAVALDTKKEANPVRQIHPDAQAGVLRPS
jgi:hypothetical protein